jgi:hypothetical protein
VESRRTQDASQDYPQSRRALQVVRVRRTTLGRRCPVNDRSADRTTGQRPANLLGLWSQTLSSVAAALVRTGQIAIAEGTRQWVAGWDQVQLSCEARKPRLSFEQFERGDSWLCSMDSEQSFGTIRFPGWTSYCSFSPRHRQKLTALVLIATEEHVASKSQRISLCVSGIWLVRLVGSGSAECPNQLGSVSDEGTLSQTSRVA